MLELDVPWILYIHAGHNIILVGLVNPRKFYGTVEFLKMQENDGRTAEKRIDVCTYQVANGR